MCDSLTSSRGKNHQTSNLCDRLQDRGPSGFAKTGEVIQKQHQHRAVSADIKPCRKTRTADGEERSKSSRVCDDCRVGLSRTSALSRDKIQRRNSPASQQSPASYQRTAKSTVRSSQTSVTDETAQRNRSNISKEDRKRSSVSSSQNAANYSNQRTVKAQQPICHGDRAASSPTSTKNRTADSATSGRRDVTSGHVTRRSLSAKTASSEKQVPGRRCQSSDDRRQRQKNLSARDHELTQAPFHRKCCCATKNSQSQGHQMTSEGQPGSFSRSSERRALPDTISKPWARTLRDYGGSDKSPSPVRSRRSTPESTNCPRTSTTSSRTGCEVVSKQDFPANRRAVPLSSRSKRPTPADIGTTKSDSTLVQSRPDRKLIPASSSLGAVTARRAQSSAASRSISRQTPRERRTTTTPPAGKQQVDRTARDHRVSASNHVPCTPSRRKSTVSAAPKEPKTPALSTVSRSHSIVKTADIGDLENSPSRAPTSTSLQPDISQRMRTRRRTRLAGNNDVSSSTFEMKPAEQRSHISKSAMKEEDTKTATVNSSRLKDRDFELEQRNVDHSTRDDTEKNLTIAANNIKIKTSSSHLEQQQLEETLNKTVTNFTVDDHLQRLSVTSVQVGEGKCLPSDTASFQHPHSSFSSITATSSIQENSSTSGRENVAETGEIIQEQKSENHSQNTSNTNGNIFERCEKNSKAQLYSGHDKETEKYKKRWSPLGDLEIERDFEFMDEILSCTTAELYCFIKPPNYHFSDGTRTHSRSMPIDTLFGQKNVPPTDSFGEGDSLKSDVAVCSFCPASAEGGRPTRSIAAGLLYTVNSVVCAPVIEVARSMSQEHCLSSPQSSDYVAENHHKVEEVSAEQQHHHHHLTGPGRRQEDLIDCSPCSDEIVLGSSDTSTKCSLSSPSGSQLSQDSCRWRSPDDSTLVADFELCSI